MSDDIKKMNDNEMNNKAELKEEELNDVTGGAPYVGGPTGHSVVVPTKCKCGKTVDVPASRGCVRCSCGRLVKR